MLSHSLLDWPLASQKKFSEDCTPHPSGNADRLVSMRYLPCIENKTGPKVSAGQMLSCDQILHILPLKQERESRWQLPI